MAKRNVQLVQDSVNGLETSNGINVAQVTGAVTDNAIARFNGTTGELQGSVVVIDDSGNETINGVGASYKSINELNGNIGISGWALKYTQNVGNGYHSWSTSSNTTAGQAISYVERMRIDPAGNVGIGVTPSAWASYYKVVDIGSSAGQFSLYGRTDGASNAGFVHNSYRNTSNVWTYKANGYAFFNEISNGGSYWYTAPSGTAGNPITWTTAMTLDASGNLGLGVTPSAWSNSKAIELQNGCAIRSFDLYSNIASIQNAYYDGVWKYKTSNFATMISQNNGNAGDILYRTAQSGTVGNQITWTTALTIPNTGGIQLPNTAIANATTLDWYEEGTATLTATGMTTAPTGTGSFTRIGNSITISIPAIIGTSNAATLTLTGVPTNFRPSTFRNCLIQLIDNGAAIIGIATIGTDGIITISTVSGAGFTTSGIKGTSTVSCSYQI